MKTIFTWNNFFLEKNIYHTCYFSLIENIEKAIDNKRFVCVVFIDLQKALGTVDHNILLQKLSHYGIGSTANQWFRLYLTNRK